MRKYQLEAFFANSSFLQRVKWQINPLRMAEGLIGGHIKTSDIGHISIRAISPLLQYLNNIGGLKAVNTILNITNFQNSDSNSPRLPEEKWYGWWGLF